MKYKLLGKSGLRVSELCLGTMTFGDKWGWGGNKDESLKMFQTFFDAGGNFIDTANRYTDGQSEEILAECIDPHRSEIVLATKYSLMTSYTGRINEAGNHRKNMVQSLEGSLKRLKTDYIDVFYLHAWDFTTPEEEVMRALDDLVRSGKVLYVAISDTPAWLVSRMNTLAELRGWSRFIGLQVEYSLLQRTPERDLIPMAAHLGLGVLAWGALGGGALTGKYLQDNPGRLKPESARLNERSTNIARKVVEIAEKTGCNPAHVALNWVRQSHRHLIPIIAGRRSEQIADNLAALQHQIPQELMEELNVVSQIELGFPHDFLQQKDVRQILFNGKQADLL